MIIETRFKPLDTIFYLEKESVNSSNKVIKQGRISSVRAESIGEYDLEIEYKLYDKKVINETWCYSTLEELKEDMLYKIKNLEVGSVIGKI